MVPPRQGRLKNPEISKFSKLLVRLKIYRNGRNLTQEAVAKKLGVSLRTYQRIEQGTAPLEMDLLYNLCHILETTYENLAFPSLTQKDLPNVIFYSKLSEAKSNYKIDQTAISQVFEELKSALEVQRVKEIYKNKIFKDHELPFFYSDPNHTWINKSLAREYSGGKSSKVSVMKDLSDFEFIIRLWEVCYKTAEPWYISSTLHPIAGRESKVEVLTLNYFTLNSGMPLVLGHVLGKRVVEANELAVRT
jgi:transcriptional regulator with XRE-family HTH domain